MQKASGRPAGEMRIGKGFPDVVPPPLPAATAGAASSASAEATVSHLTFYQLLNHAAALGMKIDGLWQRIIYLHIGMVAVVMLLAESDRPLPVARFAVMAFYSLNVILTYWNLRDAYRGLVAAVEDMNRFEPCEREGATEAWVRSRRFARLAPVRAGILLLFWLPIAWLVLSPIVFWARG